MAEEAVLIAGGVVIAILVFAIAYRFFIILSSNSLKTITLNNFNEFYSYIEFMCAQEVKSESQATLSLPENVRAVYAAENDRIAPKVVESIKNGKFSSGSYICLQFKNEQEPKCYQSKCNIYMPFMGSLEPWNDLQLMVKKILKKPLIKDYFINITKTNYGVSLTYDGYDSFQAPVLAIAYIPLDENGLVDTTLTGSWNDKSRENLERQISIEAKESSDMVTEGTR